MVAVELLDMHSKLLGPDDMPMLERLLRNSHTWALVDSLAATVVGALVTKHPQLAETLDRWATDEDFWLRRSAMLALLVELRQGRGDWDRFARYADSMLEETEFFIRKAMGWILRDTSKRRPDLVYDWLAPRAGRASGVTVREAVRYLTDDQREAVMSAYRERWSVD
jgi:3-methyladenine DNA glycosylase AlkD